MIVTTLKEEAQLALAAKGAAEKDLARLATCPPWRHAAFAATEAALVLTPALVLTARYVVLALALVGMGAIYVSEKRRLGVFINGYRRGRTRRVTFPLLAAILGLYVASVYFGLMAGRPAVSVALALVTFVVGYAGSVLWQRVFVRELGA